MAACYWSYNIQTYLNVQQRHPELAKALLFSEMLSNPRHTIEASAHWLGLEARQDVDIETEMKLLFSVYSKGAHSYSPDQRLEEITNVLDDNRNHLKDAEETAKRLLGDSYPLGLLPGHLSLPVVTEKNKQGFLSRFIFGNRKVSRT